MSLPAFRESLCLWQPSHHRLHCLRDTSGCFSSIGPVTLPCASRIGGDLHQLLLLRRQRQRTSCFLWQRNLGTRDQIRASDSIHTGESSGVFCSTYLFPNCDMSNSRLAHAQHTNEFAFIMFRTFHQRRFNIKHLIFHTLGQHTFNRRIQVTVITMSRHRAQTRKRVAAWFPTVVGCSPELRKGIKHTIQMCTLVRVETNRDSQSSGCRV